MLSSRKENKAIERAIEKEVSRRYDNGEAEPDESFSQTLQRVKRYVAWKRAPGESLADFRKRITALDISMTVYPAWKRAPGESEEEFARRYTNKKVLKL